VTDQNKVANTNNLTNQVYSFVPIPGAQQHKRPRRRYEEIERMYKCGWNGCEKAYGTLNHLNAHVTMQAHGTKRTPEGEFYLFSFHCGFLGTPTAKVAFRHMKQMQTITRFIVLLGDVVSSAVFSSRQSRRTKPSMMPNPFMLNSWVGV
jgi:uncharacterized membrane protein YsdA (DUF1294 family)